jgi:hypothetical protein
VFEQIAIGLTLMVVTTFVHTGGTIAALEVLRKLHARRWGLSSRMGRASLVAALVVLMSIVSLFEASIWAGVYMMIGAIPDLEPALYFSIVTFTTLGYGDITLNESWRLLGSFEAANGVIMFGWTTALIFAFVQRVAAHDQALAERLK